MLCHQGTNQELAVRQGIPNLSALQAFEATARLGSFTRAADELALTHSAIHRQVTALEQRLGVKLFHRVRRRVALTDAGAEYASRIRRHLDHIEKDTSSLISHASLGTRLHIAVLPTLATNWLIPNLPEFATQHPDISVSLSLRTLPFRFDDQPFDAAIYHSHAAWAGTQGRLLFTERELVPVCSPLMAEQGMQGLPHIHLNSRPDAWRQWYEHAHKTYRPEVAGGPRYEMFAMVLAAVKAGLGVGLVPRFLAQPDLARGDLVAPFGQPLPVAQGYYFGYSALNPPSAAVLAFEQWLSERAKDSFG